MTTYQPEKNNRELLGLLFIVIAVIILGVLVSCNSEMNSMTAPITEEGAEELKATQDYCATNKCEFEYGETDFLRQPLLYRTGYIPDPTRFVGAQFYKGPNEVVEIPERYDLRERGLAPVRNQRSCGSCWAFGTKEVVEDLVMLHDKKSIEIAAQWMVDCEPQSYSGCRGGDFAFKKLVAPRGAVYEGEYPLKYSAVDRACQTSWLAQGQFHERIESYGYVGGLDTRLGRAEPTTKDIQVALLKYGPLGVTIAASGLSSYKSGYYNQCANGNTNHIVTIVGWETYQGQVYWIMKNSWGEGWGMNGYMNILAEKNGKKCNRIGEDEVVYAVYKPACLPQPIANAGPDQLLIKLSSGSSVLIGSVPLPGTTYSWSPVEGLQNPTGSITAASPAKTTTYKLTATTKCGTSESVVKVRVLSENGREIDE